MTKSSVREKRMRRHRRVRSKIKGTAERPRLSVFRSNRRFWAQLINDDAGRTLFAAGDLDINPALDHGALHPVARTSATAKVTPTLLVRTGFKSGVKKKIGRGRVEVARLLGKFVAENAAKKKISRVVFDRGGYKYHGLVRAFAEGARQGGLIF